MRHAKLLVQCMWYTMGTKEKVTPLSVEHLSVCYVISEDGDAKSKTNSAPYLNKTSRQAVTMNGLSASTREYRWGAWRRGIW